MLTDFAVIGTREPSPTQTSWVRDVLNSISEVYPFSILHTGAAIGIDQFAAEWWLKLRGRIALHLPWRKYESQWVDSLKRHHSGQGTLRVDGNNAEHREIAAKHHATWEVLSHGAKALHTRNVGIISPCKRVYAAPGTKPWGGGTSMGIKIALHLKKDLDICDPLQQSGREWKSCGC